MSCDTKRLGTFAAIITSGKVADNIRCYYDRNPAGLEALERRRWRELEPKDCVEWHVSQAHAQVYPPLIMPEPT